MNLSWDKSLSAAIYRATKRSAVLRPIAMFCATSLLFVMVAVVAVTLSGAQETETIVSTERLFYSFVTMIVPLFFTWLVSYILQHLLRRSRPFEVGQGEPLIKMIWIGYSFPSGHTALAFAIAAVGQIIFPSIYGIWLFICAALVGLSRVAVGVHYLLDVIAGAIIGALVGGTVLAGLLWLVFMSGSF